MNATSGIRWSALATLAISAACGDGPTGLGSADLRIIAGDGQAGLPGWELRQSLAIRVERDGDPVSGATVAFEVDGNGALSTPTVTTGLSGLASVSWTLDTGQAGDRTVTATLQPDGPSVTFRATALTPEEADLVVVQGTLGPLIGFVLLEELQGFTTMVAARSTSDTLIHLPPMSPLTDVVVFGYGNRPLRIAAAWSDAVDTVRAEMLPPVAVDLDVNVRAGDFSARKADIERQLEALQEISAEQGLGVTVGAVSFVDNTSPGGTVDVSSSGLCSGLEPEDAIEVALVSTIDAGAYGGWGCWSGHIFLAESASCCEYLLAHELGHTMTLEHTAGGMMRPNPPHRDVREGETFRAHFHALSSLNRIFAGQPEAQRRYCNVTDRCIPEDVDLQRTTVVASEPAAGGPPVDAVGRAPAGR